MKFLLCYQFSISPRSKDVVQAKLGTPHILFVTCHRPTDLFQKLRTNLIFSYKVSGMSSHKKSCLNWKCFFLGNSYLGQSHQSESLHAHPNMNCFCDLAVNRASSQSPIVYITMQVNTLATSTVQQIV